MYITGNSSILLNIAVWLGLWIALSVGLLIMWIALVEFNIRRNNRRQDKAIEQFFNDIEEYRNDIR